MTYTSQDTDLSTGFVDVPERMEVCFYKGMRSVPSRKVFNTRAAFAKWLYKNNDNITIIATTTDF